METQNLEHGGAGFDRGGGGSHRPGRGWFLLEKVGMTLYVKQMENHHGKSAASELCGQKRQTKQRPRVGTKEQGAENNKRSSCLK